MYKNSILRMVQLFKIEWANRWKLLLASISVYMVLVFICLVVAAQNMNIAQELLLLLFMLGSFLLFGIQLANVFPEWKNQFKTIQLLQLPAKPYEKYLVRISFPFVLTPAIFSLIFFSIKPILLQAGFALTDFMIYPLYEQEIVKLVLTAFFLPLMIGALFLPGALLFKRAHLFYSLLLLAVLFLIAALTAYFLNLPSYSSSSQIDGTIGGVIGAQAESYMSFFRIEGKKAVLYWYGMLIPLMFLSSYWLFKQREV